MPKIQGVLHFFYGKTWIPVWAVMVLFVWIAWPPSFYFLNDDLIHIPLSAQGNLGHRNSIRLVGDLSLMLDYRLFGKSAWGYHLTNTLLHLANFLLVFKISGLFFRNQAGPQATIFPLVSSILFLLFGFHSDAVFWIIGRSASLGVFFFLLTVYAILTPTANKTIQGFLVGCFWLLSLFSYESVWFLPALMVVVLLIKSRDDSVSISKTSVLLIWILFLLYLFIRNRFTGAFLGTYEAKHFEDFSIIPLLINYGKLIFRTFLPPITGATFNLLTGACFLLIFLFGFILLSIKGLSPALKILLTGWLLSYLPYLSLGISINTIESERFLYMPSLFFSFIFIYILKEAFSSLNKPFIFYGIVLLYLLWHSSLLVVNAGKFQSAGNTVKETYSELSKYNIETTDTLIISHLPETMYGIPVFRSGFEEGHQWLIGKLPIIQVKDSMNALNPLEPSIQRVENGYLLEFNK